MGGKNQKEAFKGASDNSQARKDERISPWLDPRCLRWWWAAAKLRLSNQKCSLTIEDFISARRSFKQCLDEMEADEIELIMDSDAYELFYAQVQRLCKPEDDDASFSNAHEETRRMEEMLQEIQGEMKRFYQEQSETNTLLLFLCALCLILLLVLILAPQPPQLTQQPTA